MPLISMVFIISGAKEDLYSTVTSAKVKLKITNKINKNDFLNDPPELSSGGKPAEIFYDPIELS